MIYIQTNTGLQNIGPNLTKEKIIEALGFTPVDSASFYEDESGKLFVTDSEGYIIAKIDENGLSTTKIDTKMISLNGEDLANKLKALEEKTPDIDLSNYYTQNEIDGKINNVVSKFNEVASKTDVNNHISDTTIHVSDNEKTYWDSKSNFSGKYADISGAPRIVNDNEDEVVICDSQGNVILRATAEGLNVAAV